ncbi:MAG: hypothetical protein [Circular genetic element sp.]|nr:MAG: hypothetical protein [Circular genetic element sp.]
MDEMRCVHCHRIDGRLWDGPIPCCEPSFPVEKKTRAPGYCTWCESPTGSDHLCLAGCLASVRWSASRGRVCVQARTRSDDA